MSTQIGLSLEARKKIFDILEEHEVDLIYEVVDGEESFNEVSIHVCDEEGMKYYIQVN